MPTILLLYLRHVDVDVVGVVVAAAVCDVVVGVAACDVVVVVVVVTAKLVVARSLKPYQKIRPETAAREAGQFHPY